MVDYAVRVGAAAPRGRAAAGADRPDAPPAGAADRTAAVARRRAGRARGGRHGRAVSGPSPAPSATPSSATVLRRAAVEAPGRPPRGPRRARLAPRLWAAARWRSGSATASSTCASSSSPGPGQPLRLVAGEVRDAVAAAIERLLGLEPGTVTVVDRRRRRLSAAPARRPRAPAAGPGPAPRAARRLALAAALRGRVRPADGATAILERHLAATEGDPETGGYARLLVDAVGRGATGSMPGSSARRPAVPVVTLAKMDRVLLRAGIGEVLHSPAMPARVAIAEWVELARVYCGDPARRLVNGVLGRIARDAAAGRRGPSRTASIETPRRMR